MKICDFKAFTLAEVMIVLTVIGVLTAILLPVARQSMPDENLMKFKKAHNTLGTVIRELVISDKYYLDGDLGKRPNGDLIDGTHEGDVTYFCNAIADVVSFKVKNCSDVSINNRDWAYQPYGCMTGNVHCGENSKNNIDQACRKAAKIIGEEILLSDNVVIYQPSPTSVFGISYKDMLDGVGYSEDDRNATCGNICNSRLFGGTDHLDANGFDRLYHPICIDIDGIPEDATENDCVNECPFGYGIRADGKILTGARADEWLERDAMEE